MNKNYRLLITVLCSLGLVGQAAAGPSHTGGTQKRLNLQNLSKSKKKPAKKNNEQIDNEQILVPSIVLAKDDQGIAYILLKKVENEAGKAVCVVPKVQKDHEFAGISRVTYDTAPDGRVWKKIGKISSGSFVFDTDAQGKFVYETLCAGESKKTLEETFENFVMKTSYDVYTFFTMAPTQTDETTSNEGIYTAIAASSAAIVAALIGWWWFSRK